MKISENALEICGVTLEQYILFCEMYDLESNRKKVRNQFFKDIANGIIVKDDETGYLVRVKNESKEKE